MYVRCLSLVLLPLFLVLGCPSSVASGEAVVLTHPDHGAPFLEQLSGQWVISRDGEERRLRFYEDGRFGFLDRASWTAGSYVILRTDERQKGVLRLEYYVDGNLHLQEVRCEIYFAEHADHSEEEDHDHGHDHDGHGHDGEEHAGETHHHEYLKVEVLPAAEQALNMAGDYLHQH
ncbi:MAG: hypothetical protein L7S63_00735 [Flavobacteriales bacterium]|nr:hypothetical protein [Flavobacteriales bacterium]